VKKIIAIHYYPYLLWTKLNEWAKIGKPFQEDEWGMTKAKNLKELKKLGKPCTDLFQQ